MNPLFECKVKEHILMIVIPLFFPNNFFSVLVQMHGKILLNLLNLDLRFDIVFVLNFDHYLDLIPSETNAHGVFQSMFFNERERNENEPPREDDKHLQF